MAGTLHVIEDLDYGGAQTQLELLCRATLDRGDSVVVASLRRPGAVGDRLREAGVAVEWLGWRYPFDPAVCLRLSRLLRSGVVENAVTWDAASGRHLAFVRGWLRGAAHWTHVVRDGRPVGRRERRTHSAADRLVTPSPTIAEALVESGVAGERIGVVPNETDVDVDAHTDPFAVRDRIGAPRSSRLIVAAGRLDEARIAKELVWAADLVRVVHPEIRFVLVGDGPARRRVERFARGAAEAGLVVFARDRGDWPELLAAAEIVWCASDSPDAPTPLLEALRAGKPVVANEAPGRDRLIVEGESGYLTGWDSRAGWARATARMLDDPVLAGRVAEAGKGRAGSPASPEQQLRSFETAAAG